HFLKKIKRELGISEKVELTPHTLRRAFATYHAENGLSLPILSKMLGHASVRTTALYWQNIYQEPDSEIGPILAGKNWLENRKPPECPPITENFPELLKTPKPIFIDQKPIIPNKNPAGEDNYLSVSKKVKKTPQISVSEISPARQEKFLLDNPSKKSDQLKNNQLLTITANNEEKSTKKEPVLLIKIKLLEEQLKQTEIERDNLKQLLQQEKQRADNYQQQLKTIAKTLYQLQKASYYQQLEKEKSEFRVQIIQPPP